MGLSTLSGMDVASGVVAFVGFAGQLLQGVSFIYNFLSEVQDAPEDIKQLRIRLSLLRSILENMVIHSEAVCASNAMSGVVQEAMVLVHNQIAKLSDLIKEHSPVSTGRRATIWSNVNIAFRKKKFGKYIDSLDRANDLLRMAQMSVNR